MQKFLANKIAIIASSISFSCWACNAEDHLDMDLEYITEEPPTPIIKKRYGLEIMVMKPIDKLFVTKPEKDAYITVKGSAKLHEHVSVVTSYTTKSSDLGAGLKFEF